MDTLIDKSLLATDTQTMNEAPLTIYIVDDEPLSRELLSQSVERENWKVTAFATANEFLAAQKQQACDLALVDIGLPDRDGFEVTQLLTETQVSGVVMVTARQDFESRIQGLQVGADAYLTKPVDPLELTATIQAVMRRIEKGKAGGPGTSKWSFDPRRWMLIAPDQSQIELTRPESVFLDLLIRAEGEPVARDKIVEGLGHSSEYFSAGRLDTLVCRLRNKVIGVTDHWQPIVTVRGIGYAFDGDATH